MIDKNSKLGLCKVLPVFVIVFISIAVVKAIPLYFTTSQNAIFYYLAGFYCVEYKINFCKMADKIKIVEYVLLLSLSVFFSRTFEAKYSFASITTFISCLFFLKLSGYLVKNEKLFANLKNLSQFSFWVYSIHSPLLHTAVNKLPSGIIKLHGIVCLVQFFAATFVTLSISLIAGIIVKKLCPRLFSILNGGR